MISKHSIIDVETKKNNGVNKMKTLLSIHIDFITLTHYCNAKNTISSKAIKAQ